MRAAVLHEFMQPLQIEDLPVPVPGPDELLIQVEACGVCHSDLHVADGDWKELAGIVKRPLVLGHEVVGRIVDRGSAANQWKIGERVGVPWIHWTCGTCPPCKEGRENLCQAQSITGVTVDGGYAEFIKSRASHTTRIPENISAAEAAPLLCAGLTVFRSLNSAGLSPGARVAIFGIGGLGHLAIQIARAFGAEVIAVDILEEKLKLAASLGAAQTLNATQADVIGTLRAAGGVHAALVASAAKQAYDTAFYCLRPGGMLLVVGLPAEDLTFSPIMMAAGEVCIQASAVGTREDLRKVLAMAAAGKLRCRVESRRLEQVNQTLEDLRRAHISGRVVLTPQ
jgi:alcohol dehydrogenase, propanol-preferring